MNYKPARPPLSDLHEDVLAVVSKQDQSHIRDVETTVGPFAFLVGFGFGGWEIVVMLAVVLVLFIASKPPGLGKGLRQGLSEFGKATRDVSGNLMPRPKQGGLIYEALTHDNRTAEFVYPEESDDGNEMHALILFLAQGFGVGRIPFAPGTFGSLVGLVWFAMLLATKRLEFYLLGAFCGFGISVWLCGAAEKILKQKDPSSVVFDEIVAIPICFFPWVIHRWLPQHNLPAVEMFFTGRALLASVGIFVLFRVFDIAKPWPVRQSQNLPGGWGVTVDDILAAMYVALLTVFVILMTNS